MTPSDLLLSKIGPESDALLRKLFEHYCRDMAQWFDLPPGFVYDTSAMWARGDEVYLAHVAGEIDGFAIIGSDEGVLDIREFFVMRSYRRNGVGQGMATLLWNEHPGKWLVRVLEANAPAVQFWRAAIASYSKGEYQEEGHIAKGSSWRYFRFLAPADNAA
jgi:predicted acetyltransferase